MGVQKNKMHKVGRPDMLLFINRYTTNSAISNPIKKHLFLPRDIMHDLDMYITIVPFHTHNE